MQFYHHLNFFTISNDDVSLLFRYCQRYPQDGKFPGALLEELSELEKLFEINIAVYSLEPNVDEENDGSSRIVARLVQRSYRLYPSTLNLNLYNDPFSYIKSMTRYSKSYQCSKCGKYLHHAGMLHRPELKC